MQNHKTLWIVVVIWFAAFILLCCWPRESVQAQSFHINLHDLELALEQQAGELTDAQRGNLIYAYNRVRPGNEYEAAYVIACAVQQQEVSSYLEKVVSDQPGLVFHEHAVGFVQRLFGCSEVEASMLLGRIVREEVTPAQLQRMLAKEGSLSRAELEELQRELVLNHNRMGNRSYAWCAGVVKRALEIGAVACL